MKRWILISVLVLGVAFLVFEKYAHNDQNPEAKAYPAPTHRTLNTDDVLQYTGMSALTFRVRTTRDVFPGKLSAAMTPAIVVWDESDFSAGGSITIRNINHGGNPVSGVTTFRTAVIHPDKVSKVELVMVPLGGPKAVSHGQLRFIFEDGGAHFLGGDPATVGEPDPLTDLILSWEAWRAPGVDYSVMKGMNHDVYQLSMRAYSGIQRFLEDGLQRREWNVYTVQLPGGQTGLTELLKVSLAMGDGAARYVLSQVLEQAEDEWVSAGPDADPQGGNAQEIWKELRKNLGGAHTGGDSRIDMAGRTGYQSLLRSCATMALYEINVTCARLIEQGHPHDGMQPTEIPEINDEPEWMAELADADIAEVFLRGPKTIAFVRKNPSTIPGHIPGALDEAGLLVQSNGKAVTMHYQINGDTPWGPANHLLIR